jgi:hypothetical protein
MPGRVLTDAFELVPRLERATRVPAEVIEPRGSNGWAVAALARPFEICSTWYTH